MSVGKVITATIGVLLIVLIFLILVKELNIYYPLSVANYTVSGELSVVGEGKVDVVPDTAVAHVGIVVTNVATTQEAQKHITEVNNKIIAAMQELGVPKTNIKTTNYSINPNYMYEGGQNRIQGYNGNAQLSIKVNKVDLLSDVIQEAMSAGANEVYSSEFTVENPEKYREQAREKAIKNAREQAQKLASTLGIKLGRVVNVVESSPGIPPVFFNKPLTTEGIGAGGGEAPNFEPGSQTISSVVTLYFEKR